MKKKRRACGKRYAMNKSELRELMRIRVSEIPEEKRLSQDAAIYENAMSLSEWEKAKNVFVYVGVGCEVRTDALAERLISDGKQVCVPLCRGKGEMDAVYIPDLDCLKPGRYGIPEPETCGVKAIPEELDVIIVPGVAFGIDGTRLGRGAGYYDRFLSRAAKAKKIALCREAALEKTVPTEPHDEKVDIIVSEQRVIKTKG